MYRIELLGFRTLDASAASAALAEAFELPAAEARRWVSAAPIKVRSNVDVETATHYTGVLVRIGADVLVRNNKTGDEKIYPGRVQPQTLPDPDVAARVADGAWTDDPTVRLDREAFATAVGRAPGTQPLAEASRSTEREAAVPATVPEVAPLQAAAQASARHAALAEERGSSHGRAREAATQPDAVAAVEPAPPVESFSGLDIDLTPSSQIDWGEEFDAIADGLGSGSTNASRADAAPRQHHEAARKPATDAGSAWDEPLREEERPNAPLGSEGERAADAPSAADDGAAADALELELARSGALELELARSGSNPPSPKPMDRAARGDTIVCPQCELAQPASDACLRCGIVFAKFDAARRRASTRESAAVDEPAHYGPGARATPHPPAPALPRSPSGSASGSKSALQSALQSVVAPPQTGSFVQRFLARIIVGVVLSVVTLGWWSIRSCIGGGSVDNDVASFIPPSVIAPELSYTLVIEPSAPAIAEVAFLPVRVDGDQWSEAGNTVLEVSLDLGPGRHESAFRAPRNMLAEVTIYARSPDDTAADASVAISLQAQGGEPAVVSLEGDAFRYGDGGLCAVSFGGTLRSCY